MAVARPVICRKRDCNDVARHELVLDDPRADTTLPKPTIATCGGWMTP
jgi:hypothetical protein